MHTTIKLEALCCPRITIGTHTHTPSTCSLPPGKKHQLFYMYIAGYKGDVTRHPRTQALPYRHIHVRTLSTASKTMDSAPFITPTCKDTTHSEDSLPVATLPHWAIVVTWRGGTLSQSLSVCWAILLTRVVIPELTVCPLTDTCICPRSDLWAFLALCH